MTLRAAALAAAVGLATLAPAARADPPPPADRWEHAVLPAVSFDTDLGLGLGALWVPVRFERGFNPYRLRMTVQAFSSFAIDDEDDVIVPFHNHYASFDAPGLAGGRLRLDGRLAFRKFARMGYYGLGNNAVHEGDGRATSYDRMAPQLDVNGRITVWERPVPRGKRRAEILVGAHGSYSWIERYAGSRLEADVARRDGGGPDAETLRSLLFGTEDHGLLNLKVGALLDTRDSEFAPSEGGFHEVSARISPGVDAGLTYAAFFASTAWFAPIIGEHFVVGTRAAVDMTVGDAPVHELSRLGVLTPFFGPGGDRSVRGIPLRRYHGKIKALLNVELRGMAPWFTVAGERFRAGPVAFADAGRVWADWSRREVGGVELDSAGSPFRVGVGGGARVQWGQTFILHVDGAYSPTDETTGFYIDIGQAF